MIRVKAFTQVLQCQLLLPRSLRRGASPTDNAGRSRHCGSTKKATVPSVNGVQGRILGAEVGTGSGENLASHLI